MRGRVSKAVKSYDNFFEVAPAETAEQLMAAFRLRYQVYCVENQFENSERIPNGLEIDAYDQRSLHSLLIHRASGEAVGTVRLILPSSLAEGENPGLPIWDICHREFRGNESLLPWANTAEVSRFAVSKKICCHIAGEKSAPGFIGPDGIRGRVPDISLGLMQAIVQMAAKANITHLCAVMEPTLLRMLGRLGIHFTPLGPQVRYHGQRQPCYSDLDQLAARVWVERHDVWQVLTRDGYLWPLSTELAEWHRDLSTGRTAASSRQ
jgi:N-acyl amino acid synthase of PEP-CTERM/exosortase system